MLKKLAEVFAFSIILFVFHAAAQDKNEWTRIESDDKEVSVSMPTGFLVDAERKISDNQNFRVISFQNRVQMEFLIYDEKNPQNYLQQLKTDGESKTIRSGGESFTLKRISGNEVKGYFSETIYLASKIRLYCFYILAENADKTEVSRFLYSIKVGGKAIFVNGKQENSKNEKTIATKELKTSPAILAVLNQSDENLNGKINYEFKKIKVDEIAPDFSVQPSVILISPYPSGSSLSVRPAFLASYLGQNSGEATVKVKLLSSGQIGSVTVYSISNRKVLYEFMEGIKKIKFLPAMKNGKPIDSEITVQMNFPYY